MGSEGVGGRGRERVASSQCKDPLLLDLKYTDGNTSLRKRRQGMGRKHHHVPLVTGKSSSTLHPPPPQTHRVGIIPGVLFQSGFHRHSPSHF